MSKNNKAFVSDRWLKKDAPASVRHSLANAKDPFKANVPDEYRMSEYGKGKRWRLRWTETDANGMKRQCSQTFAKRSDADAKAIELSDAILSGKYQNRAQRVRTFSEAAQAWRLTWRNLSSGTAEDYAKNLERYILPRWGTTPLVRINETDINQWLGELSDGTAICSFKRQHVARPHSAAYVRYIAITFGAVLSYAISQDWLTRDPMRNITVRRTDPNTLPERKIYLRPEEIDALAHAAETLPQLDRRRNNGKPDTTSSTLIYFLAYTGLRIGEALALRVGDVDLEHRRVSVSKTLRDDGTDGPTKNKKTRVVAMPSFIADALRKLTAGMDATEHVFQTSSHTPLNKANWRNRVFNMAVKSAGMDTEELAGLRPHSLRHTYASMAVAAGCDVITLANSMGHSNPSITLNTYADLWPDRLDEISSALERTKETATPIGR